MLTGLNLIAWQFPPPENYQPAAFLLESQNTVVEGIVTYLYAMQVKVMAKDMNIPNAKDAYKTIMYSSVKENNDTAK